MATGSFVIVMVPGEWQIGTTGPAGPRLVAVDTGPDGTEAHVARRVAATLRENGYRGQRVTLAIPSDLCLCAGVQTNGLPRNNAHQAMVYRLEEKLPLAAEDTVADFVAGGGQALGVCVQIARLAGLVEALEQQGIGIDVICPTALLALQHRMDTAADGCDLAVWGDGQHLELFDLAGGTPVAWQLLTSDNDGQDLILHMSILGLNRTHPLRVATSNVQPGIRQRLTRLPDVRVLDWPDQPIAAAATLAANEIAAGKRSAWVNLRRDALAPVDQWRRVRVPLASVAAAAVLLLVCLCGAMLWRAGGYHRITMDHQAQQAVVYSRLFPGRPVPVNIKSRLASEQRRLNALNGHDLGQTGQVPVLVMLRDALSCLPEGVRYRILELQLDENRLYLEGQARSHSDAEALAAALNDHDNFIVGPPRTEKLSGQQIAFTIRGTTVNDVSAQNASKDQPL